MALAVAITGATGRMGRLVQDIVAGDDRFVLHAALDSRTPVERIDGADVVIDVTRLEPSRRVAEFALDHGIDAVIGTSGWSRELIDAVAPRAERSALVIIPNFSVASALQTKMAQLAAPFFDSVEVVEAHHAGKADSPSGTAVRTAELIADAHGGRLAPPHADQPARGVQVDGVPVHSLRLAGVNAKQQVLFGGAGEVLTIEHDTVSQDAYRAGIVASLLFAHDHTGLTVGLGDVMGLN